ncbi:MAG: NAD(P)H-dependent oxidoreductase [Spirochaetia bacterium]|jgi:multimeric flavodoxin WrbA
MKAMILNGACQDDAYARLARRALDAELAEQGWEQTWYDLAERKIAPCMGDFFCFVRTPGMCMSDDVNREIAREMVRSDLLVLFTPITFGGYSSELKKAVDHFIQNVLPYFSRREGEIHHTKRYARYPDLLVIGWLPEPDPERERIFRALVHRNALNFYSPSHACGTLHARQEEAETRAHIHQLLESLHHGGDRDTPVVENDDEAGPRVLLSPAPRTALLLVGSPRASKSTSEALGSYLMEQLAAAGLRASTLHVQSCLQSEEGTRELLAAVRGSDLVMLAFPLYIDSLPAPLIRALELIAAERLHPQSLKPQILSVIINCGFPEAAHNRTGMAICRQFARQASFAWAGSMLLGAGEGLIHGTPLKELGGRAKPLTNALDSAAKALQHGEAIPAAARISIARNVIPPRLYLLMGWLGWKISARRYKTGRRLRAQPYMA